MAALPAPEADRLPGYSLPLGQLLLAEPRLPRTAVSSILISRCKDGRITDQRLQLDRLGLLQQLGVMPELTLAEEVIVAQVLYESRASTGADGRGFSPSSGIWGHLAMRSGQRGRWRPYRRSSKVRVARTSWKATCS